MSFKKAIVRLPGLNFDQGLTRADLGPPDLDLAQEQHNVYCAALKRCALDVTVLNADPIYPDSVFVEDTAVLTSKCAIIARPGAPSRVGETAGIKSELSKFYDVTHSITEPGTVDGGDVCEVDDHFLIGISNRTNEAGALQLRKILASFGYSSSLIDIRSVNEILHLKSGIAYLGDHRLVAIEALANRDEFRDYDLIRVEPDENYAANCLQINWHVLVASGHPVFEAGLRDLGYQVIALEMTEFQKMDGGLSCLSLRF
ncbi:MAG: dimethylarginine dimethylaminohydrolase family protein [Pyrinomonadaceae bacterium]